MQLTAPASAGFRTCERPISSVSSRRLESNEADYQHETQKELLKTRGERRSFLAQTNRDAGTMDAMAERIHKMVSTLNYTELDELIALAQREREGKLEQARRSLMAEFEEKAASIGLTPDQLFGQTRGAPEKQKRGKKGEQLPSAPAAVKFRSPSGQTWSGRGRKPTWLTQAEAAGQSAEDFRVQH